MFDYIILSVFLLFFLNFSSWMSLHQKDTKNKYLSKHKYMLVRINKPEKKLGPISGNYRERTKVIRGVQSLKRVFPRVKAVCAPNFPIKCLLLQ
jgi:hypothetical protein